MILIKSLIFITFILLVVDLILKIAPKSNLEIIPKKYNFNKNEVTIDLKIFNNSKNKETMIPRFDLYIDFFENGKLSEIIFKKSIIIEDGNIKRTLNNYWPTVIVKSKSSINLSLNIKFDHNFNKNNFAWLKIIWENYGHFGLKTREDCFLINNNENRLKNRELIEIPINKEYKAIAIKTDVLGIFDNPQNTIINYCKDIIKKNDILVIGETPLAIMQGRYINPKNLDYTFLSKILCYFFHPTSSLATACGMQLLINKIGITRIIIALFIGLFFKLIGIKGIFYRLTGSESSLIDDISGTTLPYDKTIVLGPINVNNFCTNITKTIGIPTVIADVNDLGGVKIISNSKNISKNILKEILKKNPAGNDDQKTPIVLFRKINS